MTLLRCTDAPHRRFIAAVMAVTLLLSSASCVAYRWRPVAVTNLSLPHEKIAGRVIRLTTPAGVVEMELSSVDFPYVTGQSLSGNGVVGFDLNNAKRIHLLNPDAPRAQRATPITLEIIRGDPDALKGRQVRFGTTKGDKIVLRDITSVEDRWITGRLADGEGPIRADLREVSSVEIQEVNGAKTALKTVGLVAGIVAVTAIVASMLKTSCPFVYIDRGDGWELVGEAYAGAAFRSTQRDDLLPLPAIDHASNVRIRLRNEALETQYTDHAELVVVDHPSDVRALSTFDQRVVLVGPARSAERVYDSHGSEATRLVSARDERLWVRDPDALVSTNDSLLADELVAEFVAPPGGQPVLEIVGGNTAWLDLVFGRFFAAMGDRLPIYLAAGNAPAAGPLIQRWREREGVDLTVEQWTGGEWQRIAIVPTVGPAALREFAIPMQAGEYSDRLKIRLRGGLGFWRFDRIAFSMVENRDLAVTHVRAAEARATRAGDRLQTISTTDGQYDALSEMNESLEIAFTVPAKPEHLARSAFLFTSGYYNVHLPVQARWQPATLKTIRDEPGALSRFSRDLARDYARHLRAAGKPAHAASR